MNRAGFSGSKVRLNPRRLAVSVCLARESAADLAAVAAAAHRAPLAASHGVISLTLVGPSVADARVLFVGTWLAALIGLEQMAAAVGAPARVATVDRRASWKESHRRCWSTIVLQASEPGIGVVQITHAIERAAVVAAQVIAIGGQGAVAVSSRIVGDNAVLQHGRTSLDIEDASAVACFIPAERTVADR
jgi:hypothetical protein